MKLKIMIMSLAVSFLAGVPAHAYEAMYGLTGLLVNKADAYQGYTLFTSPKDTNVYLIDMQGQKVHSWKLPANPLYAELLPSGNILVNLELRPKVAGFGGENGRIIELNWKGDIVWEGTLHSPKALMHHGFDRMPNGNTLVLAWEQKTWKEAVEKGRNPAAVPDGPIKAKGGSNEVEGIWPDMVVELDQKGHVVWEWHVWDHLGTGPDQINLNNQLAKSFGDAYHYSDWTHFNSVRYNAKTDQVLVNSRNLGESFIIDKKSGKIEWRWGNPGNYGAGKLPFGYGEDGDQQLFGPHDANWLPNGNISIFDNGTYRPSGAYSRVVEMNPKTNKVVWSFNLEREFPNGFYSAFQSSAQKLPNNNYFVNVTAQGHMFEVTPAKEIVWEYINPISKTGPTCIRGPKGTNGVHRAFRYAPDFSGLAGKPLTPQGVLNPGCPELAPLMDKYIN